MALVSFKLEQARVKPRLYLFEAFPHSFLLYCIPEQKESGFPHYVGGYFFCTIISHSLV